MSKESRRQEEKSFEPKCPKCRTKCKEAILHIHFPRGTQPVCGYKCSRCEEEMLLPEDAKSAQQLAGKLGMFESGVPLTRKIIQAGNTLAVHIPKEIERLLGLTKGTKVQIMIHDDNILIRPV